MFCCCCCWVGVGVLLLFFVSFLLLLLLWLTADLRWGTKDAKIKVFSALRSQSYLSFPLFKAVHKAHFEKLPSSVTTVLKMNKADPSGRVDRTLRPFAESHPNFYSSSCNWDQMEPTVFAESCRDSVQTSISSCLLYTSPSPRD